MYQEEDDQGNLGPRLIFKFITTEEEEEEERRAEEWEPTPSETGVVFIPCFPSEEQEDIRGEESRRRVLTPLHYMYPYPGTEKDEVAKGDLTLNYQVKVNTSFQTEVKIINLEPGRKRSLRVKLISSLGGLKVLSPEVPITVKENLAAREQSLLFSFQVKGGGGGSME